MKKTNEKENKFILRFDEIGIEDVPYVWGKNASLGEMYRNLVPKGVNIPNGFAITAYAYRYLLKETWADKKIKEILSDLDTSDLDNLAQRWARVRSLIKSLEFPEDLTKAIIESYKKMEKIYWKNVDVAVRSSATAEDLPDASFAGQQDTYLNILDMNQLSMHVKDVLHHYLQIEPFHIDKINTLIIFLLHFQLLCKKW